MKRLGPWLTRAAVAVLGVVLLLVNISKEPEPAAATSTATTAPATTTSSAPAAPAPGFPAKGDYVGRIAQQSGGSLTLEISVDGDKAIAYACDGKKVESWLQGTVTNGKLTLTGKNGATLEGTPADGGVRGALSIAGGRWDFTAPPVTPPAGLYIYSDNGVRQSWIIDGSGAVTGVRLAADGTTSPAAALGTDATATIDGKKITANKVGGGDRVG